MDKRVMKLKIDEKIIEHPVKRVELSEPQIEINEKTRELTLNYKPRTSMAVCTISDVHGRILCSGKLEGKDTLTHCIKELQKGIYSLCIVDGEDMIKKQFRIG